jgi:tetratricopeptide (TPR) repeat protein
LKVRNLPALNQFEYYINQFKRILQQKCEYFSHQTALFLLGLIEEPPQKITVVSQRRRRNRKVGPFELVFITRSKAPQAGIIQKNESNLNHSTIEQTLIDLLQNINYAPKLAKLGKMFSLLDYNKNRLLILAKETSETVYKRISFLLSWSGDMKANEIPNKSFKRTPIKLDPRETKELIWNKIFYCKYPRSLLKEKPGIRVKEPEMKIKLWKELRNYKPFLEYIFSESSLPILNLNNKQQAKLLDNFFEKNFESISPEELDQLFLGLTNESSFQINNIPILFSKWIENNPKVLFDRSKEVIAWVIKNLESKTIFRVESALKLGMLMQMRENVIQKVEQIGFKLYSAGRFSLINQIADNYLASEKILPQAVYLAIAKTFTVEERYEEALTILDKAQKVAITKTSNDYSAGELFYTSGLILTRLNRYDEALSNLFIAKEYALKEKNIRFLARTEISLGSVYFSRGFPKPGRNHYLAGLSIAKQNGQKDLQASFLGNLGLIEYDIGRYAKAKLFLSQATALHKILKNDWSASICTLGLGKVYLKMGQFTQALKAFLTTHTFREKKKRTSSIYETASLIAWVYEILGKTASAKSWWNLAEKLHPQSLKLKSIFVGEVLKAMNFLLNKQYKKALEIYQEVLISLKKRNSSHVGIGDCHHGIAACKIFLEEDGAEKHLKLAMQNIGTGSNRISLCQVNILAALYFPEIFTEISLEKEIDTFVQSKSYDPFWGALSNKLFQTNTPATQLYLTHHINKSPATTLKSLIKKHPIIDKAIKRIKIVQKRADEFVTFSDESETKTVHLDDYKKWQTEYPKRKLIFDAPAGILFFNNRKVEIKPGSIPHILLTQLLLAKTNQIEIAALYKAAWGMEFDLECDLGAFKSSLQRLKAMMKKVTTGFSIVRSTSNQGNKALKLKLSVPWLLIYR